MALKPIFGNGLESVMAFAGLAFANGLDGFACKVTSALNLPCALHHGFELVEVR